MRAPLKPLLAAMLTIGAAGAFALGNHPRVGFTPRKGAFPLVRGGVPATVLVDPGEWPGVARAARDLQGDLGRVGGRTTAGSARVLVGTLGKSPTIDRLVAEGKLDVAAIRGRWEASVTQVVGDTLVVAGADKRGTIYALYDLSEAAGVSPWNWWADVPVKRHREVTVTGRTVAKSPAVRYRGIFLNDEAPALTNWVLQNYGDYNHVFYERVFELLLRLRANYLWPAMWNNRFSQDDPLNPAKADEYGIVMGTSHVEPMMRADKEWNALGYGEREWNYTTHPKELEAFWRDGVVRNRPYENVVTMAMRGKIDTPMSETANIELLEKIVAAQRKILAENVNPDVTAIPQLWCLYKEVQEYYEKGMRVPDDVTLLWSDDNWGDVRRLPTPEERGRKGGAGVYYHFDYVGGPRNYKWIDTNPIPKIWEQMTRAHAYGADRIWIVNVGDLKPMEFPMEFFLTLARDPDAIGAGDLVAYSERWAAREFGPEHAREIAAIVMETRRLNGRRKPELLSPTTYSVENYREAERVAAGFDDLIARAERIDAALRPEYHSAFFQLVLHPAKAAGNLNALYVAAGRNAQGAAHGAINTVNATAAQVTALFEGDARITAEYHALHGGKWNHFMDQTHIGYTGWQQPEKNVPPDSIGMALYDYDPGRTWYWLRVEGGAAQTTGKDTLQLALESTGAPTRRIELSNLNPVVGDATFATNDPWIRLSMRQGRVDGTLAVDVSIDWARLRSGIHRGQVLVAGPGQTFAPVEVVATKRGGPMQGFLEGDGAIAIEPDHTARRIAAGKAGWTTLPGYGRTLSAVTPSPVEFEPFAPGKGPCLEYDVTTFTEAKAKLHTVTSASLAFTPGRPLRYAVAIDDEAPQVVASAPEYLSPAWERAVEDNARDLVTEHNLKPGRHTIRIWAIDPGVVIQRLILDLGGLRPSYLGPPESRRR